MIKVFFKLTLIGLIATTFLSCSENTTYKDPLNVPKFEKRDLLTDKVINNYTLKGKYTVIDFWGTWCAPCIDALPDLISLNEKYGSQINILSIADDKTEDINKLKKLIIEKKLNWNHILSNKQIDSTNRISNTFDVIAYPTLIILNPNGKEVGRYSGYFMFRNMSKNLEKFLDK